MKTIIVDDHPMFCDHIAGLLRRHFPAFELCKSCYTVDSAREAIDAFQPDLLFLDMKLDRRQNGFQLLDKLRHRSFQLVIVSLYPDFALEAFHYNAVHYLTKPPDERLFVEAVQRAHQLHLYQRSGGKLEARLMIASLKNDGWLFVDVANILRVSSEGKSAVKVHYLDNGKVAYTGLSKSIGEVEKLIEAHGFLRVHDKHLINLKHARGFRRLQSMVVMSDQSEVEVSRRKSSLLKDRFIKL